MLQDSGSTTDDPTRSVRAIESWSKVRPAADLERPAHPTRMSGGGTPRAPVAQVVEQAPFKRLVVGSSPTGRTERSPDLRSGYAYYRVVLKPGFRDMTRIPAHFPRSAGRFRTHTSQTWQPRPGPPAPGSGVQVNSSLPPAVAAAGMSNSTGSNGFDSHACTS